MDGHDHLSTTGPGDQPLLQPAHSVSRAKRNVGLCRMKSGAATSWLTAIALVSTTGVGVPSGVGALQVVVLSTYPRSGTSWVRELIRGSTGVVCGASSRTIDKHALDWIRMREAPPSQQSRVASFLISRNMMKGFKFVPNSANHPIPNPSRANAVNTSIKPHLRLDGVKDSVLSEMPSGLLEECNGLPQIDFTDGRPIPPLLLKSHFPAIGRSGAGVRLVTQSDRRIHVIRNPFDTIVSGFHGSNMLSSDKKVARWAELTKAAANNRSTPEFNTYIAHAVTRWVKYQEYWLRFEGLRKHRTDALYVHYEDLCASTSTMLPTILNFSGIQSDAFADKRLACATRLMPCSASPDTKYPEHLNMYTPEQINRVFRATASVLPRLGYRVVGTNVIVDEVSLREASLLHAHDQLGQT